MTSRRGIPSSDLCDGHKDTRALEKKVAESDIDVVNRWKAVEMAKGHNPSRSMRQHYAEVANLKLPFLRHTKAMQTVSQALSGGCV